MDKCFHGVEKSQQCFYCEVIKRQALGGAATPEEKLSLGEKLTNWALFWKDRGLTMKQSLELEAQRVALSDGLLKEEDLLLPEEKGELAER